MKLVFFGTGVFAVPPLRSLASHVLLVVAQPDRPSGRGHRLGLSPVKEEALTLGLKVETPEKARAAEFVSSIEKLQPDALVVASYGQILSERLLSVALRGGINLHGSLLPKYRGAAPIQRSIQHGESETGVTLMQMDKGMDTGDIIAKKATSIRADETYGELQDRLALIAADLAEQWIVRIGSGEYPRLRQDETLATLAPKIEKSEARVNFSGSTPEEYDRIRAFTPAPGSYFTSHAGTVRISRALRGEKAGSPGTVVAIDDSCEVSLRDGSLRLLEVQPEGKKRMSGRDFANGLRLRVGTVLV